MVIITPVYKCDVLVCGIAVGLMNVASCYVHQKLKYKYILHVDVNNQFSTRVKNKTQLFHVVPNRSI